SGPRKSVLKAPDQRRIPMVKCVNCGTAWTSSGLPLCPVCGARVEEGRRPDPVPVMSEAPSESSTRKGTNGSAALQGTPEVKTAESDIPVQLRTEDAPPVPVPVQVPKPEPYIFSQLKRFEPGPASALPPAPPPEPSAEPRKPGTKMHRIPQAVDASGIYPVQAGAKVLP